MLNSSIWKKLYWMMWKTCISTRTWTRVFGMPFQCLYLSNICWMFVEYLTNISDSSCVNWIFAEGLSNIRLMSVECLMNVCWISDRYVRHFLCELNILNVYRISDECVQISVKCLSNIWELYQTLSMSTKSPPNVCQNTWRMSVECLLKAW